MKIVIANFIMLAGCILLVIAGAAKKARHTVILQTVQLFLAATANFILGGYTGATLNIVSIIRNIIVLKGKYTMLVRIGFVLIMIAAGIYTNNRGLLGYGIILGNAVFTACLGIEREEILKLALAFCILWWAMYDLMNMNYVGAVFDIATFVSSIIGFIRIRKSYVTEHRDE